jgi:hypothetical protein
MWKAVCLALACLLGMSAVLAFMPGTGDRVLSEAAVVPSTMSTLAINEAEDAPVVNTASKADKLSLATSDAALQKDAVETIKVAPTVETSAPTRSAPKAQEVTNWHWHVGSKIKRTVVRER